MSEGELERHDNKPFPADDWEVTLKVENLSKVYVSSMGKVASLRNVNFSVNKGEFVSVVGPSGSGKSTVAKRPERHLGMSWLQVDDLRLALQRSRVTLPGRNGQWLREEAQRYNLPVVEPQPWETLRLSA